jgi:malate dehydrogenase (oxaloacetate-decarboxylating)
MTRVRFEQADGRVRAYVPYRGRDLLNQCLVNKSTAFNVEERRTFGIEGLVPHGVTSIGQQVQRAYGSICRKNDPLERFIGMAALQNRNETLFYRVLLEHVEELMPIVYTPTVGQACQDYSHIFRRGRGLWITPADRGRIAEVLGNSPMDDIRLIVVTDNERILGLGDQGAGGIGIPIGKLALYTMAAGIHPAYTLPISLDVGTDNRGLLEDDLYIGWRKPRLRGPEYDSLVEEFVQAVKQRFPRALLQWEDFKKANAFTLLDRYREVLPSFNDDIQGTAAVALAGMIAACRAKREPLDAQRVVILGAGAAGIGIARQLRNAFERAGLSGDQLVRAIALSDSQGLLVDSRPSGEAHKQQFAWTEAMANAAGLPPESRNDLELLVRTLRPTILIGTSGQPGVFDEKVVRAMAAHCARPVIFPLSNPTSKSEARPVDLLEWTDGKALIATGSPFDPVERKGVTHCFAQGNNVWVFPGVGLGALVAETRQVTDSMFTVAAHALAESVSEDDLARGLLFPSLRSVREVTARIAQGVVREARDSGLGRKLGDEAIAPAVHAAMWYPDYPELVPA